MSGMTLIVKTITRLILGFIVVLGTSVVLYGHITPGGGFAGGVMLACGFILFLLAFGKKAVYELVSEKTILNWDSLAALSIIEIMFIGLYGDGIKNFLGHFLTHGEPLRLISGGTIMWSNINVGIKVSVFLFVAFMTIIIFRLSREK